MVAAPVKDVRARAAATPAAGPAAALSPPHRKEKAVSCEAALDAVTATPPVVVGAVSTSEDDRHLIFENDACAAALCICASFASMAFLLSRWASCFSLCTCSWCIALAAASGLTVIFEQAQCRIGMQIATV